MECRIPVSGHIQDVECRALTDFGRKILQFVVTQREDTQLE